MANSDEAGTTTDQKILNHINISFENLNYTVKVGLVKRCEYLKFHSTFSFNFIYFDTFAKRESHCIVL